MVEFGLVGKDIGYSFSKSFFTDKFEKEGLSFSYKNFDIPNLDDFLGIISANPFLKGLNVTIPYKEKIIPFLDELDTTAEEIGAVNVIKITQNQKLVGYNTDYYGFRTALSEFCPFQRKTALILGTGGASKAVAFSLKNLGFEYKFVSRSGNNEFLDYSELDRSIMEKYLLIVNCTPLGTFPNIEAAPSIPYQFLSGNHVLFDLIYNPLETEFLKRGKHYGAKISNGLNMLELQAEKAWEIWNG